MDELMNYGKEGFTSADYREAIEQWKLRLVGSPELNDMTDPDIAAKVKYVEERCRDFYSRMNKEGNPVILWGNSKPVESEEFLEICAEKGITPILSTIPSTPTVDNSAKNEWVKNWALTTGGRYIDFARAVGGDRYDASLIGKKSYVNAKGATVYNSTGYEWYANMLYADLVHPDELGAKALYMQALADFPELMREN